MRKLLSGRQIFLLVLITVYCGCHQRIRINRGPLNDWYEKTRLIMTQEEMKIFRSLRGKEQLEDFFADFWRIRDPIPETEENENRIEFQNRILFANRWFDRHRRRRQDYDTERARGWLTDKGRIFVIFGPPDKASYGEGWTVLKEIPPQDAIYETWYYAHFDLSVSFEREKIQSKTETNPPPVEQDDAPDSTVARVSRISGSGGWRLMPSFKIIEAVEKAKLEMISPQYRNDLKHRMYFRAKYIGDRLRISIPPVRLNYIEEEGKLKVYLLVELKVYRDDYKEYEAKEERILAFSEKDVLEHWDAVVDVVYKPAKKGRYVFDVTVTDLKSEYLAKYRKLITHVF